MPSTRRIKESKARLEYAKGCSGYLILDIVRPFPVGKHFSFGDNGLTAKTRDILGSNF
jgi:hypothetical protein